MVEDKLMALLRSGSEFKVPGCDTDQARAVVEALLRIYERAGALRAEDVVEEARSAKSPLHDWFEWDDSVAAEQYRLQQARQLVREIRVERVSDGAAATEHVFVNVRRLGDDEPQAYRTTDDVRAKGEYLHDVHRQRLATIRRAVADIQELGIERKAPQWLDVIDALSRVPDILPQKAKASKPSRAAKTGSALKAPPNPKPKRAIAKRA